MKLSGSKQKLVWDKTHGKCWYCGKQTFIVTPADVASKDSNSNDWFSVDHIIPKIAGGTNDPRNLLPCCMGCNRAKSDRTIEEYRDILSRKLLNIPRFTAEQVEYLRKHNIELPRIALLSFWGEKTYEH